jgi:hypothetical protein
MGSTSAPTQLKLYTLFYLRPYIDKHIPNIVQSASQPVSQSASKKYILSIFALKTCLLVRSFYAQQIVSAPMVAILTTVTIIEKIINIVIVIAAAAAIIITIIFMIINDKNKNNNSNNNNLDNE